MLSARRRNRSDLQCLKLNHGDPPKKIQKIKQNPGAVYLKSRGGLPVPNSPYSVVLMVPVDIKQHLKKMKQTKQKN